MGKVCSQTQPKYLHLISFLKVARCLLISDTLAMFLPQELGNPSCRVKKSMSVKKSLHPKFPQKTGVCNKTRPSPSDIFRENSPTFSARKIVNFNPKQLKLWNSAFQTFRFIASLNTRKNDLRNIQMMTSG